MFNNIILWIYFFNFILFFSKDKVTTVTNINPCRDLLSLLVGYQRLPDDQMKKVLQLRDLLDKILMFDPQKRLNLKHSFEHPFIQERQ